MKFDLNCDLGEREPPRRTRALLNWITSANVACGRHAGDVATMIQCVRWARETGVRLGAHPGWPARGDLGRSDIHPTLDAFAKQVCEQVSDLDSLAHQQGVALHHIKLHGALYHASERDPALARGYVALVKDRWPTVKIFALAGGNLVRLARDAGLEVWEEAFADRAYLDASALVPRTRPGAVIRQPALALRRMRHWLATGEWSDCRGRKFPFAAQTFCVHSDTPHALELVRRLSRLSQSGRKRIPRGPSTTRSGG